MLFLPVPLGRISLESIVGGMSSATLVALENTMQVALLITSLKFVLQGLLGKRDSWNYAFCCQELSSSLVKRSTGQELFEPKVLKHTHEIAIGSEFFLPGGSALRGDRPVAGQMTHTSCSLVPLPSHCHPRREW